MFGPGALRLFLAFMVLVSHVSAGRFGVVSVMVFFILSGYWVTRMFQQKYALGPSPVRGFYLSRFLRLWPAFACAILLAIALRAVRGETVGFNQLSVLAMLGVASGMRDPLQITWSLDIEVQFYLILPLLVAAALLVRGRWALPAAVLGAAALGWLTAYLVRIETVLQYLPAFAAGIAIQMGGLRVGRRAAWWSVAAFVVIGALLLLDRHTAGTVIEVPMNRRVIRLVSLFWALSLVPFVAWTVRLPAGRLDRHMGDLSYSLYLTHYPVVTTLAWALASNTSDLPVLGILVSLAAATGFYLLIDRPAEAMRQWLLNRAGAAEQTPESIRRAALR